MIRWLRVPIIVLVALHVAVACARPPSRITPGTKIGDMVVVTAMPNLRRYTTLCRYPENTPNPIPPGTYQIECEVPPVPVLWIDDGWVAKDQQTLEANWQAFTWELFINGQPVDLDAFGVHEETVTGAYFGRGRMWKVALENASGKHTIRLVHHIREDTNDGWETYRAGTYDTTTTMTVRPK